MAIASTAYPNTLNAPNYPVLGPTYPIAEPDAIAMIERRVDAKRASGELAALERTAITRARRSIDAPRVARELPEADRPRRHRIHPSVVTNEAIRDELGAVLVPAGTVINPLEHRPLSRALIFFDGRRKGQVEAVRDALARSGAAFKPVLVAGNPIALTRAFKRAVYFDQNGTLVRRFAIESLPAIVRAVDRELVIESMPPALLQQALVKSAGPR